MKMFVADMMNNVRRLCSVRGQAGYRKWQVRTAVAGRRYLVRNFETGQYLTVSARDLSSLY